MPVGARPPRIVWAWSLSSPLIPTRWPSGHVRGVEAGPETIEEVHVFHGKLHEPVRGQIWGREKLLNVGVVATGDDTELAVGSAVEQVLAERVRRGGLESPHEVYAKIVEEAKVLLGDGGRVGGRVQEDRAFGDR